MQTCLWSEEKISTDLQDLLTGFKQVNFLFTYLRCDGRSQSSFSQTVPVKTFKPPEQRNICFFSLEYIKTLTWTSINSLVLLDVLHSILQVPQSLWRTVPVDTNKQGDGPDLKLDPERSDLENGAPYLQSFLMRLAAFFVIFLGNSIMSMPLRMTL